MAERILLINPNSTAKVTEDISIAVDRHRKDGSLVDCITLDDGPAGIMTQRDVDEVVAPLLRETAARANSYNGIVIACYSDPGVQSIRESTVIPVFGVAQTTLGFAATLSDSIGVISLKPISVGRHQAQARANGLGAVICNDRAADITINDLVDGSADQKLLATADRLIKKDGAEVLILGCCGMSPYAERIARHTGLTVLEPTYVTVGIAKVAANAGYLTPPRGAPK
jgi:Asp/Glu/hydantoin racemase